jgi:hypothetical protein
MIRDEITELAEKNKWRTATTILVLAILDDAVREEREACAKVCDEIGDRGWNNDGGHDCDELVMECAAAIRARGEK